MPGDDRPQDLVALGYDELTDAYTELESESAEWPRMRHLRDLLANLPDEGAILSLGCGNGLPEMAAIQKRHRGVGVDISAAQIERARRNVPSAHFIHGDMLALDFDPESFDGVVSFYAVEHLRRNEHGRLFERFHRWLRPGGQLLFTLEAGGDEPGRTADWLGVPMFFSYYDAEATTELLERAGFVVLSRNVESQLEGDREIEYVWFQAYKR